MKQYDICSHWAALGQNDLLGIVCSACRVVAETCSLSSAGRCCTGVLRLSTDVLWWSSVDATFPFKLACDWQCGSQEQVSDRMLRVMDQVRLVRRLTSGGHGGPRLTSGGRVGPRLTSGGHGGQRLTSGGRVGPRPTSGGRVGPRLTSEGHGGPMLTSGGRGGPRLTSGGRGWPRLTSGGRRWPRLTSGGHGGSRLTSGGCWGPRLT